MTAATLAIIMLIAIVGSLFALRPGAFQVPVVIGELLLGILFGASGLGLLDAGDPIFAFLGNDIGFALVMFVAGAHVPLRSPALRTGFARGAGYALAVGVLAVPAGLGLAALFGTGHGLIYAVLIASSSAALVLPSLGAAPVDGAPIVAMIAQIAIADAACIILLPLVIEPAQAGPRALGVLAVLAGCLLLTTLLLWAERSGARRRVHAVSERHELALELKISLLLLFTMVAMAGLFGVSPMLAGFGVGLAVAAIGEPRRLGRQLFALTEGFFGPIFFVWLGAGLGLREVVDHPQMILLGLCLGLVAVLVHGLMVIGRQPLPVAVSTAAQLGVPIAAATLGRLTGAFADGEDVALIIGALLTVAVTAAASGSLTRLARSASSSHPASVEP